jgi:hypothetical protein
VGANDQNQVIFFEELFGRRMAPHRSWSALARSPGFDGPRRIGPEEIGKRAIIGNLAKSVERVDLVNSGDGRAQSAVDAKDALVDDGCNRHFGEDAAEIMARVLVELLAAFRREPEIARHLPAFVIAAEQRDLVREFDFETEKEAHNFN